MIRIFLLSFLAILKLFSEEVVIEVLPDNERLFEERPVEGTIVVTYPANKELKTDSFSYQKSSLVVDFLRRVSVSGQSPLNVDSFRFKLPPMPKGLQTLAPISVKVGDQSFSSTPVAVKIQELQKISVKADKDLKAFLKLESIFIPDGPLYPGQKALVGYRYLFSGNIELKEEKLPLLDQEIFTRLGEKYVEERQEGQTSIREVMQRVVLSEPGSFEVPAGRAAGYRVEDRGWGPKTYFEPLLMTETPAFQVRVKPFPEAQKPSFFNGALGPFLMRAKIQAPPRLERGDRFIMNVTFNGEGVHSTLKALNLLCLPGWAGFFTTSDLPPQEKGEDKETVFSYEIRPTTVLATEVPSIWFAYFDPFLERYETILSDPIPIKVVEANGAELPAYVEPAPLTMEPKLPNEEDLKPLLLKIPPYESVLKSPPIYKTSYVLFLIPLALLILWFRFYVKEEEAL
ncbi:MAG: BatD family protein [Chlamydiia bacterium]|nr:BatD family protein [Chlamydiia bacterium]